MGNLRLIYVFQYILIIFMYIFVRVYIFVDFIRHALISFSSINHLVKEQWKI